MNKNCVSLGGGDPDLRDAKVSLWARGRDYKPNGAEIVWWTQSQSNPELGQAQGWRRANWAYTGFRLTDFLLDGKVAPNRVSPAQRHHPVDLRRQ